MRLSLNTSLTAAVGTRALLPWHGQTPCSHAVSFRTLID